MTLERLQDKIAEIMLREQYVSQVKFGSVYNVNFENGTCYPLLCLELLSSKINQNNVNDYTYRMVYLDMLTQTSDNLNYINQQLVYTFNHLLRVFENEDDIIFKINGDVTYVKQELKDLCGGGYVNITVSDLTPYDYCEEI